VVDSRTFYEQNRSLKDHLSSYPGRLHGLHGPNERFFAGLRGLYNWNEQFWLVTWWDGARPLVLI